MEDACGKPVENVDKFGEMSKIKGWRAVRLWISLWTVWMTRSIAHRLKMQEAAFFPGPVCSPKAYARLSMPGEAGAAVQRGVVLRDGKAA